MRATQSSNSIPYLVKLPVSTWLILEIFISYLSTAITLMFILQSNSILLLLTAKYQFYSHKAKV